ncbi:uncharacterized protein [Chironomus tepperi]|uniref:uncharacterized protein n=1 Tax=Chironomus tepperi TaxID=113505 RepID=UPI00391F0240
MSLTILLLTLMLSIVVLETDSCTSFTGWKLRHVDVEHKEPTVEREMTTKMIDIEINYNNIKNISRMQRYYTEPIILQVGAELQRCEHEFEQVFCHNHGKCIKIKAPGSSNNEKAQCICDTGYADPRCMTKLPDGEYKTVNDRSDINHKLPATTTIESTIETKILRSTTERNIANEKDFGEKIPCPEPFDQHFCIHGECFTFSNTIDGYYCICHDDFTGLRCEEKGTDHYYQTRKSRREIRSSRRKRYKTNSKFRELT